MAARRSARPLYAVFLERVIKIEAVQCYREAVTDNDYTARVFFSEGVLPGTLVLSWSVDGRPRLSLGARSPGHVEEPVSLPMQHAWNAAVAAWKGLIAALVNGELIANGVYQATGIRDDLDPAEWTRTCLMLDVRDGDLIEGSWPSPAGVVRWTAITLRGPSRAGKEGQKSSRQGATGTAEGPGQQSLRAEDKKLEEASAGQEATAAGELHSTVERLRPSRGSRRTAWQCARYRRHSPEIVVTRRGQGKRASARLKRHRWLWASATNPTISHIRRERNGACWGHAKALAGSLASSPRSFCGPSC